MSRIFTPLIGLMMLTACAEMDMQGHDPYEYYTAHPIKNTVRTEFVDYDLVFTERPLPPVEELEILREQLAGLKEISARRFQVMLNDHDSYAQKREAVIRSALKSLGLGKVPLAFVSDESLEANHMVLIVEQASIVSPRCPDWRTSPVTTYSNTHQGNFGCATETNLGLMLANPDDLEGGKAVSAPDAARNAKVLQGYRNPPEDTSGGASSSDAPAAATTVTGQ